MMTGAGIGVGVARKLEGSHLVIASAATAGMVGAFASKLLAGQVIQDGTMVFVGPGEPLGAAVLVLLVNEENCFENVHLCTMDARVLL